MVQGKALGQHNLNHQGDEEEPAQQREEHSRSFDRNHEKVASQMLSKGSRK